MHAAGVSDKSTVVGEIPEYVKLIRSSNGESGSWLNGDVIDIGRSIQRNIVGCTRVDNCRFKFSGYTVAPIRCIIPISIDGACPGGG